MAKDETRGSLMLKKLRLCGIIALLGTTTILSLDYLTREYHARVIEVTDGDTIKVKMGIIWTVVEKIRLVGLDTPETKAPGIGVQCFGPEASAKSKELLHGKVVRLESDSALENRDKYNRLLRYVHRYGDKLSINEELIKNGFGREATYDKKYKYQKDFRASEDSAYDKKLGLWGECSNYKKKRK